VIHFETSIVDLSACSQVSKRPSELDERLVDLADDLIGAGRVDTFPSDE
jgi:hypothetical protein